MLTGDMMKVCMIVHNPPFQGGIVQFCVLLANAFKDKIKLTLIGFKNLYPSFLYKGKLPKVNQSGINFEAPFQQILKWYNPFSWINALIKAKNSDIIHIHWVTAFLGIIYSVILWLNKLLWQKKVVMTCHNITDHEKLFLAGLMTKIVFSRVPPIITVEARKSL